MIRSLLGQSILSLAVWALLAGTAFAQAPSAAGPLLRLLQSGRLPPERQPPVVEMVCKRGNAEDLAFIFSQVQKPDAFAPALRQLALDWLLEAAEARKVVPSGDKQGLAAILADAERTQNARLERTAVALVSAWQVRELAENLRRIATRDAASPELRAAAIDGLASFKDAASRQTLEKLAATGALPLRFQAVAALAQLDVSAAARFAAEALSAATATDDPGAMIDAFLERKEGADQLAAALGAKKPSPDVAKVVLRYMFAAGRNDAALSAILSDIAGVAADPPPPSKEEVQKLVAEVLAKGDAVRGERIFRRADLGCFNCHAIARAGGQVGPELTGVGAISPTEYIVTSILDPSAQIKEAYLTKVFDTADGRRVTGIVVDRDAQQVKIRDATGKTLTIAADDIDDERDGKSLMPQGVTKFLTHDELLDLIRFVGELGKPGPFAARTAPTIQRWRVLANPAAEVTQESPNVELVRQYTLDVPASGWKSVYGTAGGSLPLGDLPAAANGNKVFILQGEIEVVEPGAITFEITAGTPYEGWVDADPFAAAKQVTREFTKGRHTLTLRVTVDVNSASELRVELKKPEGSPAQFDVVGGA